MALAASQRAWRLDGVKMKFNHGLLYLTAATIPFPATGIPLTESLFLSPAMIFGTTYALASLLSRGIQQSHLVAAGMLLVFALTAMPRHDFSSYGLSLGALAVAIAPLTAPVRDEIGWQTLLKGFLLGLHLTLIILSVEVGSQVFGLPEIAETLKAIFPYGGQGEFLDLVRPKAGFLEPSHLAIYLAFAFVIFDNYRGAHQTGVAYRVLILIALVLVGSLSGIAILAVYFVFGRIRDVRHIFKSALQQRRVLYGVVFLTVFGAFLAIFSEKVIQVSEAYFGRLSTTMIAIGEGSLEGSEASRSNAFVALPRYWNEFGVAGFLFGTGYANYKEWLIGAYGHLGPLATFGRGQIDNMLVAVALSTGVAGVLAYVTWTVWVLRRTGSKQMVRIGVFLLVVNFAFGYLVLYLYWYLLFVLAGALSFSSRYSPRANEELLVSARQRAKTTASEVRWCRIAYRKQ